MSIIRQELSAYEKQQADEEEQAMIEAFDILGDEIQECYENFDRILRECKTALIECDQFSKVERMKYYCNSILSNIPENVND